jgi:hypothetical protein
MPFGLVGGLILLRNLTVNGQRGSFILDTGSSYALVVNNTSFAKQLRAAPKSSGLGATGQVAQQQMPVANLQFGAARYTGFTAQAISLEQIHRYVGPKVPLLGILGAGILRDYEVVIDYPHLLVTCYSLQTKTAVARPFVRQDSLAFPWCRGAPLQQATLAKCPCVCCWIRAPSGITSIRSSVKRWPQLIAPCCRARTIPPARVASGNARS